MTVSVLAVGIKVVVHVCVPASIMSIEVVRFRDVGSMGARRAVCVLPVYRRVLATPDARSILVSSSASPTALVAVYKLYTLEELLSIGSS